MDHGAIVAVEDALACGYPREADAVLIIELDGLRDGMDDMAEKIAAICRANGALEVRTARDEAERAALWRGRQGSFAAINGLSPNYLSVDGTVPRSMLPETLRRVGELGEQYGLRVITVLHAGDGNLHPSFLYDGRDQEAKTNAEAAAHDFLKICAELGGTVSGEHGIGIEKLEAMHLIFSDDDLRVQGLVKEAFDPRGLCNPGKVLPSTGAQADA
jgi:FAD/FMN-containing dehydrogenase